MFVEIKKLCAHYEGQFTIKIGEYALEFDLDPDITTIIDDIFSTLEHIQTAEKCAAEIYFFEQGSDTNIVINKDVPDTLSLRVRKGEYVSKVNSMFPETTFEVKLSAFIQEWAQLITIILDLAIKDTPNLARESFFADYKRRLADLLIAQKLRVNFYQRPFYVCQRTPLHLDRRRGDLGLRPASSRCCHRR
ncbi:MAG: hypothetical protein IPK78_03065 [Rhodospirillales bacterium]|nr:hypothetical protein [Rhodospirillales bacterium]